MPFSIDPKKIYESWTKIHNFAAPRIIPGMAIKSCWNDNKWEYQTKLNERLICKDY